MPYVYVLILIPLNAVEVVKVAYYVAEGEAQEREAARVIFTRPMDACGYRSVPRGERGATVRALLV